MTKGEITGIARFLDLAEGFLAGGYRLREERGEADCALPGLLSPGQGSPPDTSGASPGARDKAPQSPGDSIQNIGAEISACTRCPLARDRQRPVPGEGVESPLVLVIGEGPGEEEDREGRPFVGRAGQLLDRMLGSVKLSRSRNCFIANTVKCRPPHNRDPLPEETAACAPFLDRQIALLKPLVILCAGRVAAQTLLKSSEGIGRLRGRFTGYRGIPLLPTYHPSALLRDEGLKRPAWEDLKLLREKLADLDEAYAAECRERRS